MRALFLALSLVLSTLAASAEPILVEMVDSKRLGWKTRKHWYQLRGVKGYVYRTADNEFITRTEYIDTVPDKRTYEKRHPYEINTGRALNLGSGLGNAVRLFTN